MFMSYIRWMYQCAMTSSMIKNMSCQEYFSNIFYMIFLPYTYDWGSIQFIYFLLMYVFEGIGWLHVYKFIIFRRGKSLYIRSITFMVMHAHDS